MSSPAGPGIRLPPPLIFAAGWAAGWYLGRQLEFEIDGAGAGVAQIALGTGLIGTGLGFVVWAFRTLAAARTTVRPDRASTTLVTTGPFRWTRNPIYLGLTAMYLGAALVTNRAWPIVLLPLVLLVLTVAVIHREETVPARDVFRLRGLRSPRAAVDVMLVSVSSSPSPCPRSFPVSSLLAENRASP